MIIHIEGVSGSGKTTLGKKISSQLKIDVIDIDDIHHANGLKIIPKTNINICELSKDKYKVWSEFHEKIFKEYNEELLEVNQIEFNKKLENYKDKHLIIVGGLHSMVIKIDKGYVIKIDKEIRYKQLNIRTLEGIYENYDEIKEILNSDISLYKKQLIIAIKYKVPSSFISPFEVFRNHKCAEEMSNKLGYTYATPDEIMNEIEQLLK